MKTGSFLLCPTPSGCLQRLAISCICVACLLALLLLLPHNVSLELHLSWHTQPRKAEEAVSLSATVLWHEARAPLTIFGYGQVALYVARLPGDLLPCPFMVRYALNQALLGTLAPKMLEISWASRLTCDTRLGRNSSSDIFSCPTVIACYNG